MRRQLVVGRGFEQEPIAVGGGELVEPLDECRLVGSVPGLGWLALCWLSDMVIPLGGDEHQGSANRAAAASPDWLNRPARCITRLRTRAEQGCGACIPSTSRPTAPARKQSAPIPVIQFATARSRMSPVWGTKWDATPAIAKATEPARLSAATHHSACRRGRQNMPPHISPQASPLAIRKQAQPNTSGAQISRFSCAVERPSCSASNVLTLKNSVPTNWTTAAHQSIRRGSSRTRATAAARRFGPRRGRRSRSRGTAARQPR